MKKFTLYFLFGLLLFTVAMPSCKKEEITEIEYIVPIWKGSLESAPSNPVVGWAYYDTQKKQSFIYDGSSWQVMAQDGKDGTNGTISGDDDPTGVTKLDWNIEWDYISDEFYPSFTYMQLLCSMLKDAPECISITVPKDAVGAKLTLTIEDNLFMDKTVLEETVTADKVKDGDWDYFPTINWKQDALLNADQSGFFNLNVVLEANNKVVKRITQRITYHSINDCVFGIVDDEDFIDLYTLFTAYVNEDNPKIDGILKECLEGGDKREFFGDQGTKQDIIEQMYWIWEYFARRNTRYSDITNSSTNDPDVYSQYVRFFDQCLNNKQANCVDGSCLLASIYRKIGLDVALVIIPGHCFLAVRPTSSDVEGEEDENIIFLETTLMGSAPDESQIRDYFEYAIKSGFQTVEELVDEGKEDEVKLVYIGDAREIGIKPIPRTR